MEQVGQPSIAWEAYERAIELQDSFWPDAAVRKKMVNYCCRRQKEINEPDSLMRQRQSR